MNYFSNRFKLFNLCLNFTYFCQFKSDLFMFLINMLIIYLIYFVFLIIIVLHIAWDIKNLFIITFIILTSKFQDFCLQQEKFRKINLIQDIFSEKLILYICSMENNKKAIYWLRKDFCCEDNENRA